MPRRAWAKCCRRWTSASDLITRRNEYGRVKSAEVWRLKELENARLKQLLADAELDKALVKELVSENRCADFRRTEQDV